MVVHEKNDRTEFSSYKGISLVAYAGKILLKIISSHLSEYCKRVGIVPEELSGFRPNPSTIDMIIVIHGLQVLARKKRIMLYVCLSILPTRTTPLTKPSSGQHSPVLGWHKI